MNYGATSNLYWRHLELRCDLRVTIRAWEISMDNSQLGLESDNKNNNLTKANIDDILTPETRMHDATFFHLHNRASPPHFHRRKRQYARCSCACASHEPCTMIGTNASRSVATSSDPPWTSSRLPLLPSHLDGAANDHLHHAAPQIMQRDQILGA